MTDDKPEGQAKWLEKVEKDQNISGLNTLDDTLKNEAGRHWFPSQSIQPSIPVSYYDQINGYYVMGTPTTGRVYITRSEVSQAVYTFTAQFRCRIIYLSHRNDTRAHGSTVSIKGTELIGSAVTAFTQAREHPIIGGISNVDEAVVQGLNSGIILEIGETLVHTDATFVAADVTERVIVYQRV